MESNGIALQGTMLGSASKTPCIVLHFLPDVYAFPFPTPRFWLQKSHKYLRIRCQTEAVQLGEKKIMPVGSMHPCKSTEVINRAVFFLSFLKHCLSEEGKLFPRKGKRLKHIWQESFLFLVLMNYIFHPFL